MQISYGTEVLLETCPHRRLHHQPCLSVLVRMRGLCIIYKLSPSWKWVCFFYLNSHYGRYRKILSYHSGLYIISIYTIGYILYILVNTIIKEIQHLFTYAALLRLSPQDISLLSSVL